MKPYLQRGLLAALAFILFLPTAHAQRGERLAEALDLSEAQTQIVAKVLDEAEPGDLWQLAADLTPTLTAEQKEKLLARPDRPARSDERPARREAMEKKHAERAEAMQEALGLTDTQVQQLDALRAEKRDEREARRAERDAELAEVLTPQQLEVAQVHHALAIRLHRHHGNRGHRDGRGSRGQRR